MSASPVPADLPPVVASWRDQIERLSGHASPYRYLAPAKWAAMRANALISLDQHGADAFRPGWTAMQLFGVHPEHSTIRVDYCRALIGSPNPALGVKADWMLFERTSGYRNGQSQLWGPPI